ncbi:MAG TPA: pyridoxal-phosphate dependent enzyme [Anaerolineales bacterium]|nr:pyridoxal-phosphate dependent enzyme [Anaerolineales bacterium]
MIGNRIIECLDCGHKLSFEPGFTACPNCMSQWQEIHYAYPEIGAALPGLLARRPFDLWRYRELLPVLDYQPRMSLGEGGTPLIHAGNLGMMLGIPQLYIKDERQGPTNSFKDRQAAVSVAALKEAGITEAVVCSTGNVAIAFSAYAARAGIKLWAFLTSLVPGEKMREVAIYGTQVIKVTGTYDEAKKIAAEFASQRGLYIDRGARSIPSVEAMKTIAFEIAEQLTWLAQQDNPGLGDRLARANSQQVEWITPDWYFQSVSGGLGPLGVQKGFHELRLAGLTSSIPAIAGIQTAGCAPMAQAWNQGLEIANPVHSPRTHIATLSTGDPGRTYTLLRQRMLAESNSHPGGCFDQVTDEEAFRAMHILAKLEGISVEPASAVAFAGLIKLVREGLIKSNEVVVVNCTGHTVPVESTVLGDNWSRSVVAPSQAPEETPQEGLLAALSQVTSDRYSKILIVDDTEDARRLIRRILQSQGNYTIVEASDGYQALELVHSELPDLIILDLMMPEIDGFAVLDQLKSNPQTAPIPIIVVTAKELTQAEKKRLNGHIHKLMQKGEFMNDELLDEVRALVK